MKQTQVYYFAKGHLGQYEDWWYLLKLDDGAWQIKHEWDHVNVGSGNVSQGEKYYSLEDGLRRAPQSARDEIRTIISK